MERVSVFGCGLSRGCCDVNICLTVLLFCFVSFRFDSSAGGYYELIHNGEQIKHQDYFTGDDEEVAFGNCGGGSTATASQQENTERNTGNH